jgi:hypothetical protein
MKKILNYDPVTGIKEIAHTDGETFVLETQQDVREIVEQNKADYANTDNRAKWGEMAHVARIPLAVFQELNKKGICRGFMILDQKAMKAWLNDPENRHFRVRAGTL